MADQGFFVRELPPAEQAGHLLPIRQLVLPILTFRGFLRLTVAAVGCHQTQLQDIREVINMGWGLKRGSYMHILFVCRC